MKYCNSQYRIQNLILTIGGVFDYILDMYDDEVFLE
jgi:hypothetical protein